MLDKGFGVEMDPRAKLVSILSHLDGNILAPSDVVLKTGLPRYEVLGAFHTLEALGIVSIVHSRNNYKLYTLSDLGRKVLKVLMDGGSLEDLVEKGIGASDSGNEIHDNAGLMGKAGEEAVEASSS
ncbi:hypothetical protein ATG_01600 [Desulfurococcaceae archaeon AG1]|jgi:predicted transcriptional regulator with HTH domain|nr:hypothetical protein ATG_01600 [Desulfurococcaceae archaeon AG1]